MNNYCQRNKINIISVSQQTVSIFGCYNYGEGDAANTWWVEARDPAKHLRIHRIQFSPQQRIIWSKVSKLRNPNMYEIAGE